MFKLLRKLRKDEKGATAIEYGLIAALVAVAAIGAMSALGDSLSNIFGTVADCLNDAGSGNTCGGTTAP